VLTVTHPRRGAVPLLDRVLIGAYDYGSGLAPDALSVTADFPIDDVPAGDDVADRLVEVATGVYEYRLRDPIQRLDSGRLSVTVRDNQGHLSRVDRRFRVSGGR
jgi:hypothetical protein